MKIKLLTYCDPNYECIGDLSIPLMRSFCKRHAFEFLLHEKITTLHSDVYWNKIAIVKEALNGQDWVMWCDADILINNLDFDWRSYLSNIKDKDFIISSDFRGLCLGLFFIRSCKWSVELLSTLETLGNIKNEKIGLYDVRNQREQDSLKVLIDFFENISSKIMLLPETLVSNPRTSNSVTGIFAHHFWANNNSQKVASEMKNSITKQQLNKYQ